MTSTKIVRTDPRFHRTSPYICYGIGRHSDAACADLFGALSYARSIGCDAVEMEAIDIPRVAHRDSAAARVRIVSILPNGNRYDGIITHEDLDRLQPTAKRS